MTVVAQQRRRRWLAVAGGVTALVLLPVGVSALPVRGVGVDPGQLTTRMRASAGVAYQGFAVSTGTAGLPTLPQLADVTDLLNGETNMRVWYAEPGQWRVDTVQTGAERDVYRTADAEYLWDYETDQLTKITGVLPVRLPRGADLLPPELARRLLAATAGSQSRLSALPSRRVAGVTAAGVRVTPVDSSTTVGRIDIWADPVSGLPVQVQVTARGATSPILDTRFLELTMTRPPDGVLSPPPVRAGMGFTITDAADVSRALAVLRPGPLPDRLAGLPRDQTGEAAFAGVGTYGTGLARFVVLPVPRRIGRQAMNAAVNAGGEGLTFLTGGEGVGFNGGEGVLRVVVGDGVLVSTPLLSLVVVDSDLARRMYLVAGLVDGALLRRVGEELAGFGAAPRMIRTERLTKRYGAVLAVDNVDLTVAAGDRYGLLGPNGSGKTTLVRMLLGLVFATGGRIEVLGMPVPRRVAEVLPRIGALVEGPAHYPHLSGRANLALFDAAGPGGDRRSRRRRIGEALERVGLAGIDRRPVKAYSLGMRQRLGLAAALLRAPDLLILDEPSNGLDPRGIREIRDLLMEINAAGATVFMSSHLLSEVEQLCTTVGVMDRGALVLQDELSALRAPTGRITVDSPDAGEAAARLDGRVERRDGNILLVRHGDPASLNAELVAAGIRVAAIASERRTLEQVVLEATTTSADRVEAVAP